MLSSVGFGIPSEAIARGVVVLVLLHLTVVFLDCKLLSGCHVAPCFLSPMSGFGDPVLLVPGSLFMSGILRTLCFDFMMVFVVDQAFLNIPERERVCGDGSAAPISLSLLSDFVGFVLED